MVIVNLMQWQQFFLRYFCTLPPFFHIHKTHPHLLSFLEGSSSCQDINLRYASHIREGFPPRTFLQVSLTYKALRWAFTSYWQYPQTFQCPRTGSWPNILFRAFTPTSCLLAYPLFYYFKKKSKKKKKKKKGVRNN